MKTIMQWHRQGWRKWSITFPTLLLLEKSRCLRVKDLLRHKEYVVYYFGYTNAGFWSLTLIFIPLVNYLNYVKGTKGKNPEILVDGKKLFIRVIQVFVMHLPLKKLLYRLTFSDTVSGEKTTSSTLFRQAALFFRHQELIVVNKMEAETSGGYPRKPTPRVGKAMLFAFWFPARSKHFSIARCKTCWEEIFERIVRAPRSW